MPRRRHTLGQPLWNMVREPCDSIGSLCDWGFRDKSHASSGFWRSSGPHQALGSVRGPRSCRQRAWECETRQSGDQPLRLKIDRLEMGCAHQQKLQPILIFLRRSGSGSHEHADHHARGRTPRYQYFMMESGTPVWLQMASPACAGGGWMPKGCPNYPSPRACRVRRRPPSSGLFAHYSGDTMSTNN